MKHYGYTEEDLEELEAQVRDHQHEQEKRRRKREERKQEKENREKDPPTHERDMDEQALRNNLQRSQSRIEMSRSNKFVLSEGLLMTPHELKTFKSSGFHSLHYIIPLREALGPVGEEAADTSEAESTSDTPSDSDTDAEADEYDNPPEWERDWNTEFQKYQALTDEHLKYHHLFRLSYGMHTRL